MLVYPTCIISQNMASSMFEMKKEGNGGQNIMNSTEQNDTEQCFESRRRLLGETPRMLTEQNGN